MLKDFRELLELLERAPRGAKAVVILVSIAVVIGRVESLCHFVFA